AKFGDPMAEKPLNAQGSGGWVTSAIPPDKLPCVSDRVWLSIIARQWPGTRPHRWKQHDKDTVGEVSIEQFARALGAAARRDPQRFARLALSVPPKSSPAYF